MILDTARVKLGIAQVMCKFRTKDTWSIPSQQETTDASVFSLTFEITVDEIAIVAILKERKRENFEKI